MNRMNAHVVLFGWVLLLVFSQGCAADKPLAKSHLPSLGSIKAVRYETPEIRKITAAAGVGGFLVFGAIGGIGGGGMGEALAYYAQGKQLREKCGLPDYGELVLQQLYARIRFEFPDWPLMSTEELPVASDFEYPGGGLLILKVESVIISSFGASAKGFNAASTAQIRIPGGELIWLRHFSFEAGVLGRHRELEELEAENCKLLKEEMQFAATKTVDDFIAHLRGGRP